MADHLLCPNFTGSENVEEWLKNFDHYTTFKNYDRDTRLAFFKLKLTSLAKIWLDSMDEAILRDEHELVKELKNRFKTSEITRHKLVRDLFAVKQQPYESVEPLTPTVLDFIRRENSLSKHKTYVLCNSA